MLRRQLAAFIALFVLLLPPAGASAFETDQYNRPDRPLADIGDEVAEYVRENVAKALAKVNARIAEAERCLAPAAGGGECGGGPEKARARLAELRSEEAVARAVFKLLGDGVPPFTNSGTWMEKHEFRAQPARYKTSFGKSIYRTAPLNYLTISDTVNLYGTLLGTDKIAHIFQQGYAYHRIVERARARGESYERGVRRAVDWGRSTEKTYYGFWVSGVYSNADLAANFAGLRFYENLTRETPVGAAARPPLVVLEEGRWRFRDGFDARAELLRPFISDHLDEALNPSVVANIFGLRGVVRRTVAKQGCPAWRAAYPDWTRDRFAAYTESLSLWHGADYGHRAGSGAITLAATCF